MKKIIGITSIVLLSGLAGVQAQSQTSTQPPQDPNARGQQSSGSVNASGSRRPSVQPQDLGIYSDCYMKCINSGHPDDFCKTKAKDFCY
jgi:hypothetical protein